jgi:ABC-2 type transport system permease protein
MLEFARYDGRKRVRGSLAMAVGLALFAAMIVWLYPSFTAAMDLDTIIDAYPPQVQQAFGVRSLSTLGGFLAVEIYSFAWVILLGMYFAYAAASIVAGDVEDERMDMLLSLPVSRARLLAERFAALAVPLVVVNAVPPVAIYASSFFVDASVDATNLVAVHALSIPYLLVCAAIGLVFSVALDRESIAQRAALGTVFGLFLLESALADTDLEWLGALAPMRYYDPSGVMVGGEYDLAAAAILLGATAVLLAVALVWFRRKDVQ